ncbi:hypothetical protein R1sor_003779 [Riccia sorocarpa]|uniref:Uncharacterized protein n=1 Tax=Riccia sorocarpa TaxID=122646 RepID=A0ABD3H2M0_9MARC
MVRDPGRAPSGPPPSQGGQPDPQERHTTHRTGAGEVRTTPSTVGAGRPPTYRGWSSGAGSSEGERPRVIRRVTSGGSGQTSIPISVLAPRPSTFAPTTVWRGSGPCGDGPSRPTLGPLDVSHMFEAGRRWTRTQMHEWVEHVLERDLEQFAAQYGLGRGTPPALSRGGASTDRGDDTRRRRSRSSHEDDHDTRDRRRSRRSSPDVDRERRPQSVPLVSLRLDTYGYPDGDSMRVLGGMIREVFRLYLTDDTTWAEAYQGALAITTRLAAKYGPVSVQHQNAKRRVEIHWEKNVMVTNPFGHQGFAGFRARFMCYRFNWFLNCSLQLLTGISNAEAGGDGLADDDFDAEAGEDGAAGDDFVAAAGVAASAGTGDDVEDDELTDFFEGLSGAELEEDEHGQTPQHEQHMEDGGDDEDDTFSYYSLVN